MNNVFNLTKSINRTVSFYIRFENNRIIKKFTQKQLGIWSKNELAKMGPTFIKIGQFISTRSDIFSKELTNELKELQDNVAPLSWDTLKDKVSMSLNSEIVNSIDKVPLASASIGQVHRAKLNNKDVIIKIKRPNIDAQIKVDFEGLLILIKFLKLFSKDRRIIEFEILFTEYYNLLQEETNFIKEADNMEKFGVMFEKVKWIKIPTVYKEFSTNDYIIMEYVKAIKMDNIEKMRSLGFNLEKIALKLIECYIDQITKYQYIHLDPHFSNVLMTLDGKIVFYDFGMVLKIDDRIKLYFDDLLVALYRRDIDSIADLVVKMEIVIIEPYKLPYLKKFMLFFLSYIEKMDVKDFKLDAFNKNDMPFIISSKFLLLSRAMGILEGNCKLLDPNFNYKKILDPYINKYLIDVNYIENKVLDDIKTFKVVPSKMKEQEIDIEIIRINNQYDVKEKERLMRIKTIALGSTVLIISMLEKSIIIPAYICILSFILLI